MRKHSWKTIWSILLILLDIIFQQNLLPANAAQEKGSSWEFLDEATSCSLIEQSHILDQSQVLLPLCKFTRTITNCNSLNDYCSIVCNASNVHVCGTCAQACKMVRCFCKVYGWLKVAQPWLGKKTCQCGMLFLSCPHCKMKMAIQYVHFKLKDLWHGGLTLLSIS